jgi:hypothetical protein
LFGSDELIITSLEIAVQQFFEFLFLIELAPHLLSARQFQGISFPWLIPEVIMR